MPSASVPPRYSEEPFVRSILCVTDFSAGSVTAFAHALMLAMNLRCDFTLLHVSESGKPGLEWSRLPGVRDILERWGYLTKGSPHSAVFENLAVRVKKVHAVTGDALGALLHFLDGHAVDLVVIATHERTGVASWLRPSLPDRVIHRSRTMTLFVPSVGRGFVSQARGGFTLKRVLVPVNSRPDPHPAITYAFRTAVFSSEDIVQMSVLHVGGPATAPRLQLPERPYLAWDMLYGTGDVAHAITQAAAAKGCDLIVMSTDSQSGFLASLHGGVTQHVVRSAPCPVLTVPLA